MGAKHGPVPDWQSALADAAGAARSADTGRLAAAVDSLRSAAADAPDADVAELAAVAAMHELPWVRAALLRALVAKAPQHDDVRQMVRWLTHDFEDFVAFAAIDMAGVLRLSDVLAELFLIVGQASRRVHQDAGKPVGIGHALVLRAIAAIVGSDRQVDLEAAERALFTGLDPQTYPPQPAREATAAGSHSHRGMVPVPAGRVLGGPPPAVDPASLVFDWDDPEVIGDCGDFWMDVVPVSNKEYDNFARSTPAASHTFCHPAEPKDKLHLRNTFLDPRSGPDHPVTGVDWFDAYAYARSLGKRLPTEAEWQRAGEGDDRRTYPWGNEFDPQRTRCQPAPVEPGWAGLRTWRADLLELAAQPLATTTAGRGIPRSASPYGVLDLSGGVWEWTSSSFDGPPLSPWETDRDAIDLIYDQRSYAVIKGGTWTSLPEQVSVAFRGRDLAFDRHFEIGFRCVCDCAV